MFTSVFEKSIIKRAQDKKLIKINYLNLRDWGQGRHKQVDDTPYGGGQGMVMKVDVIVDALKTIKPKPYVVLLSASGKKYSQQTARTLSKKKSIAIICGHYEGVDARTEEYADIVLSTGDYVLTGGEIPAMAIVDSVTRLIPGTISKDSVKNESFSNIGNMKPALPADGLEIRNYLEYPQYTKPEVFQNKHVPKILLSGNHANIKKWRDEKSLQRTKKFRPDLLK